MKKWKEDKIENLCELIVDCVNRTAPSVDYETPFKMIRTTNIKNGKIDTDNVKFVTEKIYHKWIRRGKPEVNDIILTREAPVGEVGRISKEENIFLGQRTMMYRANQNIVDPQFLFYSFFTNYFREQILSAGMGSVVEHIRVPDAKEFIVKYPPLPEQRAIASVLSSLDDKIDLLYRQNQTLEAMAETLFRQWFVEEAEEEWEEGELADFIKVKHGYAFKGKNISTEENSQILVTPGNFNIGGGFKFGKMKYYNGTEFPKEYIFNSNDLIVTMTDLSKAGDTLGYSALIPEHNQAEVKYLHNQRVGKVIIENSISKLFLYYLMKTREYQWFILGGASGTSVRHTSPTSICKYPFQIPPSEKLEKFDNIASQLIAKSNKNSSQITTLSTLRDTLLPKLMSGEVRVKH